MTGTASRRRGYGEDAIYFDAAKNRFVGAISVGFGPDGKRVRRKVTGRTKAEVRDELKAAHAELDRGLHTSATYTVQHAVDDWLEGELQGRRTTWSAGTWRPWSTTRRARSAARAALSPWSSPWRCSKRPASRLNANVVLSLATGIRTEEARELHWDHVDLDGDPAAARPVPPSVAVWRSVREGGDTKTAKSRRTLALPKAAVQALRDHRKRQAEDRLAAGSLWQDHGLVFASAIGTPLDAANVRREFRQITEAAGLGLGWAPRDLRHTFVSLMSADGVPIEEIARLAGHNRTATTELVYRHELRPVITTGAEVMDRILNSLS